MPTYGDRNPGGTHSPAYDPYVPLSTQNRPVPAPREYELFRDRGGRLRDRYGYYRDDEGDLTTNNTPSVAPHHPPGPQPPKATPPARTGDERAVYESALNPVQHVQVHATVHGPFDPGSIPDPADRPPPAPREFRLSRDCHGWLRDQYGNYRDEDGSLSTANWFIAAPAPSPPILSARPSTPQPQPTRRVSAFELVSALEAVATATAGTAAALPQLEEVEQLLKLMRGELDEYALALLTKPSVPVATRASRALFNVESALTAVDLAAREADVEGSASPLSEEARRARYSLEFAARSLRRRLESCSVAEPDRWRPNRARDEAPQITKMAAAITTRITSRADTLREAAANLRYSETTAHTARLSRDIDRAHIDLARADWLRQTVGRDILSDVSRDLHKAVDEANAALSAARIAGAVYEALTPARFEEAIAELLRRDGHHKVYRTGGARDLGADVLAETHDGKRIVVQCKRYRGATRVGSRDVQTFAGTCFAIHKADLALLVTTSEFTTPAYDTAHQLRIVPINGFQLKKWQHGMYDPAAELM